MKRIGYGIIGVTLILGVILCVVLYKENSRVKEIDVRNVSKGTTKVVIESMEELEDGIVIVGYLEEEEPIFTVDVAVLLYDSETDEYFMVPTEFVEKASAEEVDTLNRRKVGFSSRIFWKSVKDSYYTEYNICILNQNNGKKELLVTDYCIVK